MSYPFGKRFPGLGRTVFRVCRPVLRIYTAFNGLFSSDSRKALEIGGGLRTRVDSGDVVYVVGVNVGAHDTGACLLRVDRSGGAQVVLNLEEDRIRAERNSAD